MIIEPFFDARTWTLTYLVHDAGTGDAVVIDPVLDYDAQRVRVYDDSLQRVEARIDALGLRVHWVLETHVHADHLSAGGLLRARRGARIAIGGRIVEVQQYFKRAFGLGDDEVQPDGRVFDRLVVDGDVVEAGSLVARVHTTPGHTPACVTWQLGDALFTGDALLMPDQGTGRCDFPAGSAEQLYDSIRKLYALPDETRIFVGHDYQPGGRELRWESTVGEQKRANIQLKGETPREQFVDFRTARDRTLNLPNLIYPSIQVNIRAGTLPRPEANGLGYLKLPLNLFDAAPPE